MVENIVEKMGWKPKFGVWELTLKCNMCCLHCGSYAGKPRYDELSLERALKLADELAELGLERITLSGGEPQLRKDWEKIARRLMDRGVRVGMISNGWFMADNAQNMRDVGKWDVVAMSLDGLKMTHDAFRRTLGSFDKILKGFVALKRKGIRTACITCVSNYNIGELDVMHDILVSHGVSAWQIQPLFVGGRTREYQEMMLSTRDLIKVAKFIARKRLVSSMEVFPADGVGYFSPYEEKIRPEGWKGCQAGLFGIGIEANGNIKGCLSLYPELQEGNLFVEGNVKEKTLKEIWNNPDGFSYNRKFDPQKAQGFCKDCKHLEVCRCGCTAEAFFSTGTPYDNPYCLYREIKENKEPEDSTKVPMTEEFRQKFKDYYKK